MLDFAAELLQPPTSGLFHFKAPNGNRSHQEEATWIFWAQVHLYDARWSTCKQIAEAHIVAKVHRPDKF